MGQAWLYYGVEHIVKYYLELRYALIQVLYDAMFENQIEGLPIARSMVIPHRPLLCANFFSHPKLADIDILSF